MIKKKKQENGEVSGKEKFHFREMTCSREKLYGMLSAVCGGNTESVVSKYRKRLKKRYIIVIAATLLIVIISSIYTIIGGIGIDEIKRPEPGEDAVSVPLEVRGEYGGEKVTRQFSVSVENRELTEAEIEKELDECIKYLETLFERDASGGLTLSSSAELPDEYGSGISISWESSDPVLVSEDGKVDIISLAGEKETIKLTAELLYKDYSRSCTFDITLYDNSSMYGDAVSSRIKEFISSINDEKSGSVVKLPSELSDGVSVKWKEKRRSYAVPVALAGAAAVIFIYTGRYRRAEKFIKKYRENVRNEFPAVIDKLILLLNSGLTVFSALMRVSEDYEKAVFSASPELAGEAAEIGRRVRNMNANVIDEWKAFAGRMESSDMLRFCTILEDNINTGSGLVEKLEAESANMREMKRKEMRKNIQMVDSRMMVPMMIMLASLILITVSPALLSF